ncbi:MAG: type II and III secretion system protein family protein, partial [Phycisphaerae bacterium]|nr:type II and III secretion system protein family protein [Phycisphaerae bacterium]
MKLTRAKTSSLILIAAIVLMTLLSAMPMGLSSGDETTSRTETKAKTNNPENNSVAVYLRQSRIIRPPWPAKRVSVTDPKIADVQVLTPRQILLQGKELGSTDLIMWSEAEDIHKLKIRVEFDLERTRTELARLLPRSTLSITQAQDDFVVVSGKLCRSEHAVQLEKFMEAAGVKYVDMTSVAGVHQVMLRVRIAEVTRSALRTMGFNAFITGTDFFGGVAIGSASGGPLNPISIGPPSGAAANTGSLGFNFNTAVAVNPLVSIFAGFPKGNLEFFLQAMAENQYLRILAEPNLVALSGEQASFLAGGEYPIPVVQGTEAGGTSITVEYREFGVRLSFRPTVLGDGSIRLHVAPEVSSLSSVGAVEIQGFSIPSVLTRKAETTLELNSGQSFAMAGLIDRSVTARGSRVPGLGDLPVIGALFRSSRYEKNETDLVILVTASLVEPISSSTSPPLPGMLYQEPNDWEFYMLGKIEGEAPAKVSRGHLVWLKKMGFDRLVG